MHERAWAWCTERLPKQHCSTRTRHKPWFTCMPTALLACAIKASAPDRSMSFMSYGGGVFWGAGAGICPLRRMSCM